ncbi:MAG: acyl-CoA dehydrogenase family protein [Actinomycetota bacterium]|nr:acyl-CoA dehydrogenase family protein [Actinomycetota bacterium]
MDFAISETQRELGDLTRRILTDQVTPSRLRAVEQSGAHFDRELWTALADAGVLAACLPETVDGGGLDLLEQCSVLLELGRSVAPAPYLECIVLGAAAIAHFGTDEQRTRWARPAAAGQLMLTAALTEDLAESAEAPATQAARTATGWSITGSKVIVPSGTIAQVFLVPATTAEGVAVFIVDADQAGVVLERQQVLDGDSVVSLELNAVEVGPDRYLGEPDLLHWMVARATVGQCARQLGVLERALELTAAYARERQQFGRPIGSFQAVGQRLADAYIDVEAVRLTMWEAAWRVAEPLPSAAEIATAKFWASDAGHRVAHTAVHIHGGTGIDVDAPLHRYFVAAKRCEFTYGSATAQLRILGAELATTPA